MRRCFTCLRTEEEVKFHYDSKQCTECFEIYSNDRLNRRFPDRKKEYEGTRKILKRGFARSKI